MPAIAIEADLGPDAHATAPEQRSTHAPRNQVPFGALIVVTFGLTILADWLFWNQPRGWTIGAYGLLLTGVLMAWERRLPRRAPALLVTAALIALLLQCLEEPGTLVVALSLLGLFTLALILREGWSASATDWLRRWASLATVGWQSVLQDAIAGCRAHDADRGFAQPVVRFVRRWSLPLLLTVVFFVLFAVANAVLSRWLEDAWHSLRELLRRLLDRLPAGGRVLMWTLIGVSVWALLRFRSGPATSRLGAGLVVSTTWPAQPSPAFVVRCLALFNTLFALQTALDVRYLWGGAELPQGLTYAQYVHRGAYPLVGAAILAAVFVLVTFGADSHERPMRWARRLLYIWLVQNLFLIVSAAWRLRLYVDAYSLTRPRVAGAIWMLLVLCGLVWILLRIIGRRSNAWLVNANTVTALMVLYVCAFIDFDGRIAGFNVAHCREVRGYGQPIDLPCLEHLGPETLPALVYLVDKSGDPTVLPAAYAAFERLKAGLQADADSWRGWTWRRQRLAQVDVSRGLRGSGVSR